MTAPANGATYTAPATVVLQVTASDSDGTVSKVEFFEGATKLGEDLVAPYTYTASQVQAGTYRLTARATDNRGAATTSAAVTITVTAPPPVSATFLRVDTTTQGNWKGVHGSDGYQIINDTSAYPAYAQVAVTGGAYTWMTSTSDVRASRKAASATDRIASTWFATTGFTFDVTLTDTQVHQVALYLLDWENRGRAQTVEIWDPVANVRLDTRDVASFSGGQYLVWELAGRVQIRLTRTAGDNAVAGALFFAPRHIPVAPTVALTGPATGATYTAPATVVVNANASDSDGTVTKVEFFQGTTKLGEDLTAPYSYSWTNVPAGSYSLTARATDNSGAATSSAAVTVTVSAPATPAAPTQLTATTPSPTRVSLTWKDNSSNETGFRIERSLNGSLFQEVASVGSQVTTFTNTNRTPRTLYYYRVRATNAAGNSAYSNVISIRTP
jgi:hypothetical protein